MRVALLDSRLGKAGMEMDGRLLGGGRCGRCGLGGRRRLRVSGRFWVEFGLDPNGGSQRLALHLLLHCPELPLHLLELLLHLKVSTYVVSHMVFS